MVACNIQQTRNVMLTIETLRESLDYDQESGVMTWRKKCKQGKQAGCKRKDGYVVIRIDDVLYYRHRLAWMYVYGVIPTYTIDHINGMPGDDRLNNLRDVPISINSENQRKASPRNKSNGFLGVQRNHGGWQGHITVKGKRILLGTYKTPQEAHEAYLTAKRKLHEGCTI